MNQKQSSITKWIAVMALLTALVVVTGYIPPAPLPVGRIYWCDAMIFLAAFLVDPVSAFIVGGVGTFLYDILIGDAVMAVVSFIIHGVQAAAVSALLIVFPKKKEVLWAAVSAVIGGLIVIGGYFLWRWAISPLFLSGDKVGLAYAISKIPANVIQEIVGIAVGMIIVYALRLKSILNKNNLIPHIRFGKQGA